MWDVISLGEVISLCDVINLCGNVIILGDVICLCDVISLCVTANPDVTLFVCVTEMSSDYVTLLVCVTSSVFVTSQVFTLRTWSWSRLTMSDQWILWALNLSNSLRSSVFRHLQLEKVGSFRIKRLFLTHLQMTKLFCKSKI